jgi:alpha-amylase
MIKSIYLQAITHYKILLMKHFVHFTFLMFFFLPAALFAQQAQLTFQVDMSQQAVSPNGVFVAGNFQAAAGLGDNWTPGSIRLTDPDGDNIYEVSVTLPPGQYLYKFINGNNWEQPSSDCSVNDGGGNFNREVSIASVNLRMPAVVFGGCNAELRFSVNMKDVTVAAEGVYVIGNFQTAAGYGSNWTPGSVKLIDGNGDGTYQVSVTVTPGNYQYRFVNGNSLAGAEVVPADCGTADADGTINRTLTAASGRTAPPTLCFATCQPCDPALNTNYTTHWWNDAVFYEVFVRSFYDSNGDGIGDFRGLIEKLDYLNDGDPNTTTDLGITGIWLMPMMESPSYHGYDVTDYYAVERDYGTMEDFQEFLSEAHKRGIKVVIDFVMNHTSSQHPWFTASASSTTNPKRDWFVWSQTNPGFSGPWGQTVWHQRNNAFYYGLFWGGMPDLNYRNADVREEMLKITNFWLDKGVDGYRLDAIKYLYEDGTQLEDVPETFTFLEEFNSVYKAKNPEAFTVGEVWTNTAKIVPYVQNDRLDACFDFDLASAILNGINTNRADPIRNQLQVVEQAYPRLQYATFLTNHDQDRVFDVLRNDPVKMKQAASLYLTMPGVPFLYYGEEIGMTGTGEHINLRRPMQWTPDSRAGFTTGNPWTSINTNYTTRNVQTASSDPNSLLNHYKKLIHIRNNNEALRKGYLLPLTTETQTVLSYGRVYEDKAVITVANLGTGPAANFSLSLAESSLGAGTYQVTELMGGQALATVSINANGGIENWTPTTSALPAGETWLLHIAQEAITSLPVTHTLLPALQVYPNPGSGSVHVQLQEISPEGSRLQVYSISGKLIHTRNLEQANTTLETSHWAPGTYLIRVQHKEGVAIQKLVIAH